MTAAKSLPARPSLESLRKQAKKLARDIAAGDAAAIARAHAQLPNVDLPLTQRNVQLVIAREYGYAGWHDLTAEVQRRLGMGLEWAIAEARRIIHDNDVERLEQLLAEYPALLSWTGPVWGDAGDDAARGLLGMATSAYADAGDAQRERWFTRGACAELLIEAGAVVVPTICEDILRSRARGLLELFHRKGLLPRTVTFFAALGDLDAVGAALDENANAIATVKEAFICACRFTQEAVASLLLDRAIALDPGLGGHIDGRVGRRAFITHFVQNGRSATRAGLWFAFVMDQVSRAAHDGDVTAFVSQLRGEPRLLDDDWVDFQEGLIGAATLNDRAGIVAALLDLEPAILRRSPPPPSPAIEIAFTYGNMNLIPLLARIWSVPDDLPHAAGMGNLVAVKRWFDAKGNPALGDVAAHAPATSAHPREPVWGEVGAQQVLDTALAWAVINRHFDVADFLLEHGADINTDWNSHEPASILHHLVFLPNPYESMGYLIDHGIDMTITDYRWNGTAIGWARVAKNDEAMAQWLEEAERRREQTAR
jgi:hypothetical protein